MAKLSVLLFLLLGMSACVTHPTAEQSDGHEQFSKGSQICQGPTPTRKVTTTFRIYQKIPPGKLVELVAPSQTAFNDHASEIAQNYFKGMATEGKLTVPFRYAKGPIEPYSMDLRRVSANEYVICHTGLCNQYEEDVVPTEEELNFHQFFTDNYFESISVDDAFKRAVQVTKKIDGPWIIQQVTFNPTEFCKYVRPKTDLYTGN